MIPFIEDYLSELIESKISYLKSNPDRLDKILQTSQTKLGRLKNFIQNKDVNVIMGYPRTPAELPCICIFLSGESEEPVGLGDTDEYEEQYNSANINEQIPVTQEIIDQAFIKLSNYPLIAIQSVTNLTTTQQLPAEDYSIDHVDSGVVSINTESLQIGDILRVSYEYRSYGSNYVEVTYESNYRIEVWSENGELTVQLYHVLKWILLSGRSDLLDSGLFIQRLSGNDFEPVSDFFPSFVYRRTVSMYVKALVTAIGEDSTFIKQLNESVTLEG